MDDVEEGCWSVRPLRFMMWLFPIDLVVGVDGASWSCQFSMSYVVFYYGSHRSLYSTSDVIS